MIDNPDKFLISTLQKIYNENNEFYEYSKKTDLTLDEYKEVSDGYKEVLDFLTDLLKKINSIDDLADQDEETIGFVFELLEDYTSNFILHSHDSPEFEADLNEIDKLDELLGMFFDE